MGSREEVTMYYAIISVAIIGCVVFLMMIRKKQAAAAAATSKTPQKGIIR
jgi:hypothetical protein